MASIKKSLVNDTRQLARAFVEASDRALGGLLAPLSDADKKAIYALL